MNQFFCSEASRQAQEDPIGWAAPRDLFVLIECPPPWASDEFSSRSIPSELQAVVEDIYKTHSGAMVLLIYNPHLTQPPATRLLIFRQIPGLSAGYRKQEIQIPSINDAAAALSACFADPTVGLSTQSSTRDILICTHGNHDKCCGKYGMPFYRQALDTVANLSLANVRLWQCSHFGGHRFAPTALDFPDGRCYGRLNTDTLTAILTRSGDLQALKPVYRGWSILDGRDFPIAAQVMERELMLKHGWEWFAYRVSYRVTEREGVERVEFTCTRPDGITKRYQGDVVEDTRKALYLIGDCDGTEAEKLSSLFVRSLVEVEL